MNVNNLNLNLLRALNALLKSKNITIASKSIGASQSSMSTSLKQLREIFDDALLVPGQYKIMQLTPFACSIQEMVQEIMNKVDQVFNAHDSFVPEKSQRTFRIGMTDLVAASLISPLINRIEKAAPNIKLSIFIPSYLTSISIFESNQYDLLLGMFENVPTNLKRQKLYTDRAVIACCKNHPICQKKELFIEELVKYPLIQFSLLDTPFKNYINRFLTQLNYNKHASVSVGTALIPVLALPGTNYLTLTIKSIVDKFESLIGLQTFIPPFETDFYICYQYWHQKDDNDPAHQWLRQLIKTISTDIKSS